MIGTIPITPDRAAIQPSDRPGTPCSVDDSTVALDEWVRLRDAEGKEDGHCKRVRMRTLKDVFKDLYQRLDVLQCNECGHERPRRHTDWGGDKCKQCGKGEYAALIDEYFSGPDSAGPVPHDFRWIACYPVTGGSEGHYIHVEFWVPVDRIVASAGDFGDKKYDVSLMQCNLWRPVRLALGKTFKGMDHAAEIARRCANLLGA